MITNKIILGIDEAGRGPVLGPMVISGIWADKRHIKIYKKHNITDSKKVSPKKRNIMYDIILENCLNSFSIMIFPDEIDRSLFATNDNLNKLEMRIFISVMKRNKFNDVYIDSPVRNIKYYHKKLADKFKNSIIHLEHKADINYTIVAAASIVSKVRRDNYILKLKDTYGNIGSGYPSDKITIDFLKKYGRIYPELFRQSWKTYKRFFS